jgi:hypothetical protein
MKVLQARRLLELKAALTPPPDSPCLSSWVANTYPCDGPFVKWSEDSGVGDVVGITCSGDGTVLELTVSCVLSGSLPSTLGSLPGLGGLRSLTLDLGWSKVTGTLPPEWGSGPGLLGLESLSIDFLQSDGDEGLSGPLPPEWGLGPGLANLKLLAIRPSPEGASVPCSWSRLDKLEGVDLRMTLGPGILKSCLPSPQLAKALQLQIAVDELVDLEGDDLVRAQAAIMSGVRGEFWRGVCWGLRHETCDSAWWGTRLFGRCDRQGLIMTTKEKYTCGG